MQPLLSPEDVRAADSAAVEHGTATAELVGRAARAVAWRARAMLGGTYGRRVCVIAGPGSNGDDGRGAAEHLRRWGCVVEVLNLADTPSVESLDRAWNRADLVIDAMFGIGGSRPLEGLAVEVAQRSARAHRPRVLAVDIPSGVDALTGTLYGTAVHADATITFLAQKTGQVFEPGRSYVGECTVADIGIPVVSARAQLVTVSDVAQWWQPRSPSAHKWSSGAVLIVGGSPGMLGAPLLAARAALRMGAGMVRAVLPNGAGECDGATDEVIRVAAPATANGFACAAVARVVQEAARMHAVVVGPGIGLDTEAAGATREMIASLDRPLVVDADGINALASDPSVLRVRAAAGLPPVILTPHDGEYARLIGHSPGLDRIEAASEAASRLGAVVLLKGSATVVAAPSGGARVVDTGTSALATAGTGDVLSGMIAALLAQGMGAVEAAAAGAWIHGTAGAEISVASDLLGPITHLRRELDRTGANAAATHPRHR